MAFSNDGINWTTQTLFGLPSVGAHPDVIYDANGFGGGVYKYKMWFWDPSQPLTSISAIQFSQSIDGVSWTAPVSISQNLSSPLVTGVSPGYFYHLYGPGTVIYNPLASTPNPVKPLSFPYVMFFDTSTEGFGPGTSVEQTGLAYSIDGLFWTRYGTEPVIIPSGDPLQWDGLYIYQGHTISVNGILHYFYSGSNGQPIGSDGNTTAHGIGHASSADGINWTLDPDNPIFYITDGVDWRNNRTYTPTVIFSPFCDAGSCSGCVAKMWFTGANSSDVRAIGYATLACPSLPAPNPPGNFIGVIKKNVFLNATEYILEMSWEPSPSPHVVLYRIILNGRVVGEVSSTSPLVFSTCLSSKKTAYNYQIVAVNSNGIQSSAVNIRIIK